MQDDTTAGGRSPALLTRHADAGRAGVADQHYAAWQALLLGQLLDTLPEEAEDDRLLKAALRRLRESIPADLWEAESACPGDPQHDQRRRLAAEVHHLEAMVNRRATMDELHRVARRCVAICEGEAVGVLAEVQRWAAA